MRLSNRDRILDAAIRVIERDGVTAVTFDSVAGEAGVTRGGMIYHFPSREALMQAINQHLADRWEAHLVRQAGKPAAEATPGERQRAYLQASTQMASRAELLFLLEASANPALSEPWNAICDRWAAPAPADADDPQAMAAFIARLAADGLWAYEYLSGRTLPASLRTLVAGELASLADASVPRADDAAPPAARPTRARRSPGR